jgi:hypothetical protein
MAVGPVRRGLLIAGGLFFAILGVGLVIFAPEQLDDTGGGRFGMPGWIAVPGVIALGLGMVWWGWRGGDS